MQFSLLNGKNYIFFSGLHSNRKTCGTKGNTGKHGCGFCEFTEYLKSNNDQITIALTERKLENLGLPHSRKSISTEHVPEYLFLE